MSMPETTILQELSDAELLHLKNDPATATLLRDSATREFARRSAARDSARTGRPQSADDDKPVKVVISDFDMPFGSMVVFIVKWTLASIPALIILFIVGVVLAAVFGGVVAGLTHR